jgi:hypothetical protein
MSVDNVWEIVAQDDRLDVMDYRGRKLVVLAEDHEDE